MCPPVAENPTTPGLTFRLEAGVLFFEGQLVRQEVERVFPRLAQKLNSLSSTVLVVDLLNVSEVDSSGIALLQYLQRHLPRKGVQVRIQGASQAIRSAMQIFAPTTSLKEVPEPVQPGFVERLGEATYRFFVEGVGNFILLLANMLFWGFTDLLLTRAHRKGEFVRQAVLIGVNALPIVLGIAFLIGSVLAIQAAEQLRQFGANLFIADLVAISITREMGPLLTAILVAGRSGSAIASELATMVISEEMDALRTMGIQPLRYVAIPRLHGGIATLPLLTILANVVGILGGMIIAYFSLDLAPRVFLQRTQEVLYLRDIFTGIFKSLVFALLIVITSSYYGLGVKGGAVGVGRATTAAVVASIFLVIFADSILGLILY